MAARRLLAGALAMSPYPAVYNAGIVVTALAGIAGAIGIGLRLPKLGAGPVLGTATALTIALSSLGLAEAGLFPLPSPYHEAFGLSLFGAFTPLLGGFALLRARDDRRAVAALFIAFVAILVLFAILNGVGGLATNANAGVWVRIIAPRSAASRSSAGAPDGRRSGCGGEVLTRPDI